MVACSIDEPAPRLGRAGTSSTSAGWTISAGPAWSITRKPTPTASTRRPNWCGPAGPCGTCAWPMRFPCSPARTACTWTVCWRRYGEIHKVSALETMQFSAISVVPDINCCVTLDSKMAGDLALRGGPHPQRTGGSEYYAHLGYVGLNVPRVRSTGIRSLYRALNRAVQKGCVAPPTASTAAAWNSPGHGGHGRQPRPAGGRRPDPS
jgi:hypothetical protein